MILEEEATIRLKSCLEHSNHGYVAKLPIMLTTKPLVVQLLLEREHRDNLNIYEEILNCRIAKCKKNQVYMYQMQIQEYQPNSTTVVDVLQRTT